MANALKLQVPSKVVIPEMDLEGTIAWIAKITNIYPCNLNYEKVSGPVLNGKYVAINILNVSAMGPSSIQFYSAAEYLQFQQAYNLDSPTNLIGKPVITVYEGSGIKLKGLIPLNMDP